MVKRVCLVAQHDAPFVEADRRILGEAFEVIPFEYHGKWDIPRLAGAIRRSDLSYSWFAMGHATAAVGLSRLLGRKSVVALGGWDVAAMPEIPYGAMLGSSRRRKTAWTLRNADLVIAPSEACRREALQWVTRDIPIVALGVDTDFFRPGSRREELVVTAAGIAHGPAIKTKGLNVFFEVARSIPEAAFAVAGRHSHEWEVKLRESAPPNVTLTGWLSRTALRDLFARAKVYAQLSAHESFGLALAEAMACGCVPVASDRGSLPEVVGSTGFIVPYGEVAAATDATRRALTGGDSTAPRHRISQVFSLSQRRNKLLAVLGDFP